MTSDGLKPRTASQLPCRVPTYGCLLAATYLRVANSTPPVTRCGGLGASVQRQFA
jgi:hypothetical protein